MAGEGLTLKQYGSIDVHAIEVSPCQALPDWLLHVTWFSLFAALSAGTAAVTVCTNAVNVSRLLP